MFTKLNSIIYSALGIVIIYGIFQYNAKNSEVERLHKDLVSKTQKLDKINEHTANLERKYVGQAELNKKWENIAKELNLKNDQLNGRVKILSNATYLIREKARKSAKSDIAYQGKTMKYVVNEIRFENGPPVGYVLIFDNGRVVSKIYKHAIDVKTIVARNEKNGKYDVISHADYILKSPSIKQQQKWFNVKYPLKISGGVAHIDPTESINTDKSFHLYNPKLIGATNFSLSGPKLGLGISFMSYGVSKIDTSIKLLQIGLDYEKDREMGVFFTPASFRPSSKYLPNTYIGPGVRLDKKGTEFFLGVSVGF